MLKCLTKYDGSRDFFGNKKIIIQSAKTIPIPFSAILTFRKIRHNRNKTLSHTSPLPNLVQKVLENI